VCCANSQFVVQPVLLRLLNELHMLPSLQVLCLADLPLLWCSCLLAAVTAYVVVGVPAGGGSNITLTGLGTPLGGGRVGREAFGCNVHMTAKTDWRAPLCTQLQGHCSCGHLSHGFPPSRAPHVIQSMFSFPAGTYRFGVPLTFYATAIVAGEEGPPSGPAFYNTPLRCGAIAACSPGCAGVPWAIGPLAPCGICNGETCSRSLHHAARRALLFAAALALAPLRASRLWFLETWSLL